MSIKKAEKKRRQAAAKAQKEARAIELSHRLNETAKRHVQKKVKRGIRYEKLRRDKNG